MSEQPERQNDEIPHHTGPGKRLAKNVGPAQTPEQVQKKKEKRIMAVMIALAVVMVVAAAAMLFYNRWVQKPPLPPGPTPTPSASPAPAQSDDPKVDPTPEPTLSFDAVQPKVGGERKSEDIFTILIFGSDTTSGLTDTMMVATYDVTNQKATVMSLPRDTLTNSNAWAIDAKKLNAVYSRYGKGERGREALKNEVSELVGFVPDYYVRIEWELVGEMVDAIGGVWFDNPYHMEYYDPFQDLNIYQEQGLRFINGDDAMQVVRWRKNNPGVSSKGGTGSDIDRLKVQHEFLKAVLKQTLQIQNITRIGQLIELFNSRVESDLALENMFWFAKSAVVGGLQVEDVEFCTMPHGYGKYYRDGDDRGFVYPISSQLLSIINESLNPFVERVTMRQLDLMGQNADGSLYSSTGRLADPTVAEVPVRESDDPEESGEPSESDPLESGEPTESDPLESGEPQESGAVTVDDPAPVQTNGRPEESRPADPGPEPTGEDTDVTDWGETPD